MPIVRGVASHDREETALRDVQARWSNRMDCENRKSKNPEVVEVNDGND
jgi:hypothetical protein